MKKTRKQPTLTLEYYREKLVIDRDSLDDALIEQSQWYQAVAARVALSISVRDQAREAQRRNTAVLIGQLREKLKKNGHRFAEADVAALVEDDIGHKKWRSDYKDAEALARDWEALKESFVQRGFALKSLCELFIGGYWQPSSVQETVREAQTKARRERVS